MSLICVNTYASAADSVGSYDLGALRLIDAAEACARLDADDDELLRMVNEGLIPAYQIGDYIRLSAAHVDKLAEDIHQD